MVARVASRGFSGAAIAGLSAVGTRLQFDCHSPSAIVAFEPFNCIFNRFHSESRLDCSLEWRALAGVEPANGRALSVSLSKAVFACRLKSGKATDLRVCQFRHKAHHSKEPRERKIRSRDCSAERMNDQPTKIQFAHGLQFHTNARILLPRDCACLGLFSRAECWRGQA